MADNSFGVVGMVATSTVLAACLTTGAGWLKDWRQKGNEAKFAALYLSGAFETYAELCSNAVMDSLNWESTNGEMGALTRNIPRLPDYPADIKWESLGIKYAQYAANFRIKVEAFHSLYVEEWEFDQEGTVESVRETAVDLGLEALELATNFRYALGLSARPQIHKEWTVKKGLSERKAEFEAKKKAAAQRAKERAAAKAERTAAAAKEG